MKNYEITIGEVNDKYYHKVIRPEKVNILFKFNFYDNFNKTIEDLKEYIFELSNYSLCPCSLNLYEKNENISEFNYLYNLNSTELKYYNYGNESLLSKIKLSDSLYVIVKKGRKCMCKYQNNLNILKKSKNEIINYYEENLN